MWVAGVDRAKPGYVVLVAAKDTEKAQEAIDKGAQAEKKPVKERSYKGVDYQVDSDGVAAGIVGDFFTVGTEPEFKRTVKARRTATRSPTRSASRHRRRARRGPARCWISLPGPRPAPL